MPSETSQIYIKRLLLEAFANLGIEAGEAAERAQINAPDDRFGDYATNAALIAAKRQKTNPQELAASLARELKKLDDGAMFSEIAPAGGFINFTLSQTTLLENMDRIMKQGSLYGASIVGGGKKVIFEYSSPNTNKPLHIGHVRNDVYGQSCIRLLKSQGYQVISCEIINDRGVHIMKSILMYMKYGEGKTPESENIKPDHFVGKYYAMFGAESAKGENAEKELLEQAQDLLRRWEEGDEAVRKVWKQMNEWFFDGIRQTYAKEGTVFDEVSYESEIYDKGRDLVMEGVRKGVFVQEVDGSVSVDLTAEGLDKKYLLRKDGTTIYITQDLYLWYLRNQNHHPDIAIVTTAAEQAYHFQVLGNLFRLLGFPWAEKFRHLPYEHVYLGKSKMSSRGGNTVSADELLDTVKARVRNIMENSERAKASVTDEQLVEDIAFGAIKYGYLKFEPNTRIYFDLDSTISLEGNTGPYIQYAHARIANIIKKADIVHEQSGFRAWSSVESDLARKLCHYPECIQLAAAEYKPNLLANYLYELASLFSRFYQEVPVLQEPDADARNFRLQLIAAVAQVLNNGLYLLGIEAPEEM